MLSPRFEQLFRRQTKAFCAYADVPREPDRVRELAQARMALEAVRREIAEVRAVEERWPVIVAELRRTAASDDDLAALRVRGMISE